MNRFSDNSAGLAQTVRVKRDGSVERISLPTDMEEVLTPHAPHSGEGELQKYALLDNVYDAALITTLDGTIVAANMRACAFFRYSPAAMRNMIVGRLLAGVTADLLGRFRAHLERHRFVLMQCYGIRQNGTAFPAEVAVNHLRPPEARLCFLIRDISLRKQTEDLLQTVNLAMKNAPIGIAALTPTGRIQYANPAFAQVMGLDGETMAIGWSFADLVEEFDPAVAMLREVMEKQQEWTGEFQTRRSGTASIPIRVTANCNRDSEGAASGAVLSVVDLTESKRAEDLMRTAARQEAMLASLSAVCHHIAQPATVILGHLDLLTRDLKTASPEHSLAKEAAEAAHHLAQLLHKLNRIEDFKTLPYLESETRSDLENRMLQI